MVGHASNVNDRRPRGGNWLGTAAEATDRDPIMVIITTTITDRTIITRGTIATTTVARAGVCTTAGLGVAFTSASSAGE